MDTDDYVISEINNENRALRERLENAEKLLFETREELDEIKHENNNLKSMMGIK